MHAWIGLGSNQDGPEFQLCEALDRLARSDGVRLLRTSGFYRSDPWGVENQAPFVNAVAELETTLPPEGLLRALLEIESRMGRVRAGERWGPRCIDLDLLTYNDRQLSTPELELPHPRMHLRAFVLRPLLELDEGFLIPGLGPASEQLARIEDQGVRYLGSADAICKTVNEHD